MEAKPEKIAIVGSGPAGLSCAYHLALKGYRPTIYEALPKAWGMLRVGIPDYRLPKAVLDREIDNILRLGVTLKTNTALGVIFTLDSLLKEGYKSVFLGIGCHVGKPGIAGENTPGVVQGVELLRRHNLGEPQEIGKSLAVIGGGNVAIDVACTAVLRLGSDVTIVYRRSPAESCKSGAGGHDSTRGLPERRESQLQPHLLPGGGEVRSAVEGPQPADMDVGHFLYRDTPRVLRVAGQLQGGLLDQGAIFARDRIPGKR